MTKAYVIADIEVTDPDAYEDYKRLSTQAAELYGARFLVRGGAVERLEGEREPQRLVLLEFEDLAHLLEGRPCAPAARLLFPGWAGPIPRGLPRVS